METFSMLIPMSGIISLLVAIYLVYKIKKQSPGNKKMQELSNAIREGAMAFLNSEYKILSVFVVIVTSILLLASFIPGSNMRSGLAIAFIVGAIFSALAGNIGMRIATAANTRTAEAVRKSVGKGLSIAFSSGAVMGFCVVGLGILGVWLLYYIFNDTNILFGFGFGASSIALFARVGGGIYTKSADIGADLVGKIEEGIPEDDPRNPAVIADQVGDNVGDVAGMGADLFESYVDSIIATMALGAIAGGVGSIAYGKNAILLPLFIAGMGIFAAIISASFIILGKGDNVYRVMRNSLFLSAILTAIFGGAVTYYILNSLGPFFAMLAGLIAGIVIGLNTEYFTSEKRKPAQEIAKSSQTGAATTIIQGLVTGMKSTFFPILATVVAMIIAYFFAEFYGVAISAVGMLSILGISLATDCYGPVADNAAGIAEMAGLGKETRERAEALDAVGNTTAAMGKGFAIGSAAITSLALIFTYIKTAEVIGAQMGKTISITGMLSLQNPYLISGIFIGAMLPFLFSAFTMGAVGKAAYSMVEEVRYQFKKFNLLKDPKSKPDYARCVEISTTRALKEMILPSAMAVVAPIIIGLTLGISGLAGLLIGSIASGFLLAIFLANAGGAWDNAKKYIEAGNLGGKGSDAHKAAVIGDTVGDPCKDTAGPSLNILIKLMSIVSLVFLPLFISFSLM
jgi:K(+)-stimulated pyrophosphate-energized sodium pump